MRRHAVSEHAALRSVESWHALLTEDNGTQVKKDAEAATAALRRYAHTVQ